MSSSAGLVVAKLRNEGYLECKASDQHTLFANHVCIDGRIWEFGSIVPGVLSPADDILDFGVAAVLVHLLVWHGEFLPSFLAKLVPGFDLVPFWTVANVYRKSRRIAVTAEENRQLYPALKGPRQS